MALANYDHTVANRFMRYVQIDTQSDPASPTQPSTEKQKDLSRILVDELKQIGINDAELDEHGYVYATIPATSDKDVPVLCYCSHVDTAPDCSGTGVKPILHMNWDGSDIVLPDDPTVVINTKEHPYLKERIGDDIITASGTTLLGAHHFIFRIAGMRADAVKNNCYTICRERFSFKMSALAAIKCIAILCPKLFHIYCIHTATNFFIRSKKDTNFSVLYFRMLCEIICKIHDDRNTGFIIRAKQRCS